MTTTTERIADIRAATRAKLAHRPAPTLVATPTGPTETLLLACHRRGLELSRVGDRLIVTGLPAAWLDGQRVGWGTALRRAIVVQAAALLAYATEVDAWETDGVGRACRCGAWLWWGDRAADRPAAWECLACGGSA